MIHPVTHRGSAKCLIVQEVLPPSGESAHGAAAGGVTAASLEEVSLIKDNLFQLVSITETN